jgi:HlyD family secretion protein
VNRKPGRRRWKRWVVIAVIIIAVTSTATMKLKGRDTGPEIETTKIARGTVVKMLTETGNIELVRTVEVKSKIAGTVQTIHVREGDVVTEGTELCVIDPDPTQTLILFQKRSGVDRCRINLDQAEKELARRRELSRTALVSGKEVEDAENAWSIALNAFNLARQELEIMEREIETSGSGSDERIVASIVRAPYNGYITQRFVEEGAVVTSGMSSVVAGTTLFQIGDPSTMIIRTNISEVDIGDVYTGAEVRITLDAYPDTTFAGVIRHISPVGTRQEGRNVIGFPSEVEIIDKDPRLRPGMSCDVDVIIAEETDVLYLPVEAVHEKEEGSEEDGTLHTTLLLYVSRDTDEQEEKPKPKLFGKKPNPYDSFDELVVETGIRSENRIRIIADVDTTVTVAADGRQFFTDREAYEEMMKKGKKSEDEKDGNDAAE